jgi:hypothetical protein
MNREQLNQSRDGGAESLASEVAAVACFVVAASPCLAVQRANTFSGMATR